MKLPFLVVDNFPHDMLISNQALKQYGAHLDYANSMCSFTDLSNPLRTSGRVKMWTTHMTKTEVNLFMCWMVECWRNNYPYEHWSTTDKWTKEEWPKGANLLQVPVLKYYRLFFYDTLYNTSTIQKYEIVKTNDEICKIYNGEMVYIP